MTRLSLSLAAAALLTGAAHAQCLGAPALGAIPLAQWSAGSGYASTFTVDDEGLTNPPIDLTPAFGPGGFPMAGAIGALDQLWINSNGEVYLTDSSLGLTQPVGGANFGISDLTEARGGIAGGSPRIFAFGADQENSVVAGATWSITADVTPGSVRITWNDMARYVNTTDRYSYSMELLAGGSVLFHYSDTFPVMNPYIGISIGNLVGSAASPSRSLRSGPVTSDSGTEGLLYQNIAFDLATYGVLVTPNGIGGYLATVICEPANHTNYGTGCYGIPASGTTSVYELFPGSVAAKAALDGNAVFFVRTPTGYSTNWLPGVAPTLYVPPSASATVVALTDDSTATITPSVAVPVPGANAGTWTISSNGILTAASTGNNGTSYTAGGAAMTGAAAPHLAWYMWRDYNPTTGGQVKYEEAGGVLYVTYDGVNIYGQTSPASFQWQVTLATGDVMMVFSSLDASVNTTPVLVGCTLAGTGADPGSITLSTALPVLLAGPIQPMALSAAPRPVINPSTLVTYTANNLAEFIPGSGVYLSTFFLSASQLPGGVDLGIIGAPGCSSFLGGLEYNFGTTVTTTPTSTATILFGNVLLQPGNLIYAQAVSLFDPTYPLPNGQNAFGLLVSNGVRSSVQLQ